MPRNRMMDYLMSRDGRNPYGSAGGYISRRRPRRMRRIDRESGMNEPFYMDNARGGNDYAERNNRQDYGFYSQSQYPMYNMDFEQSGQSNRNSGYDGHYPANEGRTYYPIEAMGTFNGYYGMPEQDFARGGRGRDYGYYDMARGGRRDDYPYYDMAGDYGETLTAEELEHWDRILLKEIEEKDKHFFSKENIEQKAKQMGIEMKHFNAQELATATAMVYTDYCMALKPYVGANMDVYIKLAEAFLNDKDASVKGGEKLAVYFDCIAEGEDD